MNSILTESAFSRVANINLPIGIVLLAAFLTWVYYKENRIVRNRKTGPEILFNFQSLGVSTNNKDPSQTSAINQKKMVKPSLVNLPKRSSEKCTSVVEAPNLPKAVPTPKAVNKAKESARPYETPDDGGAVEIPHISKSDFHQVTGQWGQLIKETQDQYGVTIKFNPDLEIITIEGSNAENRKTAKATLLEKFMTKITLPILDSFTWTKLNKLKAEKKITILKSTFVDGTIQEVTFLGLPRFCRQFFF